MRTKNLRSEVVRCSARCSERLLLTREEEREAVAWLTLVVMLALVVFCLLG